jgi:hypothetical protein
VSKLNDILNSGAGGVLLLIPEQLPAEAKESAQAIEEFLGPILRNSRFGRKDSGQIFILKLWTSFHIVYEFIIALWTLTKDFEYF